MIFRFPDGGISKVLIEGVYPMQYTEGRLFLSTESDVATALDTADSEMKSITFTANLIREYSPGAAGLPSPLDYTKKRRKEYIRDLIELKGDFLYRREIIRKISLNKSETDKILEAMEKKALKPDSSRAMEYSFIFKDTKEALKKAMGEK